MDWVVWVVVVGFASTLAALCGAGCVKGVLVYFRNLEAYRKAFGIRPRRGVDLSLRNLLRCTARGVEFVVWLTVKRMLRPCLRRMLVGGPRLWLWAIARLVLFPCFALHLAVVLLTLALVEDKSMHLHRPPVFITAAFFGVAALVDCCLYATVRTPRTQLQTRLFAKMCAGALLSDALLTAFLRSALRPMAQLHCLEPQNRPLFQLYGLVQVLYVRLGVPLACLGPACGARATLPLRAGEWGGAAGPGHLAPRFVTCLLCSTPPEAVVRTLAAAGLLAAHPSAAPALNTTANGTVGICSFSRLPPAAQLDCVPPWTHAENMTALSMRDRGYNGAVPPSPPVVVAPAGAAPGAGAGAGAGAGGVELPLPLPCADMHACVAGVAGADALVPRFFLAHAFVLLLAIVAAHEHGENLHADAPETADDAARRMERELMAANKAKATGRVAPLRDGAGAAAPAAAAAKPAKRSAQKEAWG